MNNCVHFFSQIFNFIRGPFSSLWYFGNFLNKAGLYICAGTGACLALQSGTFNLGGEAQIYAPALVSAVILSQRTAFATAGNYFLIVALFCFAFISAMLVGAVLAGIPGVLKAEFGTSELLSSFLLSAALLPVLDYIIAGPLRDKGKNLLATKAIAPFFRLPSLLEPSYFNISFFIALLLVVLTVIVLKHTRAGFVLSITGKTYEFAKYAGFKVKTVTSLGMAVSGALHGVTGFFAITGTWFMCHQGFSSGMGWGALAIALIAQTQVSLVIPAALLYAWIESASDIFVLSSSISFDSTSLIQGIIFLVISARFFQSRFAKSDFLIKKWTVFKKQRSR